MIARNASDELIEKSKQFPTVLTPRPGHQIYFRSEEKPHGNQKLAYQEDLQPGETKPKALIETRGEGGYAVVPGSPASVHQNNTPYRIIQGDFGRSEFSV